VDQVTQKIKHDSQKTISTHEKDCVSYFASLVYTGHFTLDRLLIQI